jgi:hypothetical protein
MSITQTGKHSWFNKYIHVFRNNGKIIRSQVKELIFDDYGIYFKVQFMAGKSTKYKHVSPLSIAVLHVLWINVDIVSDVELSNDDDSFYVPPECDQLIANFELTDDNEKNMLTATQTEALNSITLEMAHILALTNHS